MYNETSTCIWGQISNIDVTSSYLQSRLTGSTGSHAAKQTFSHNPIHVIGSLSVHFHSDILNKPFFFHPLLGTIHPDSFVRDLISGQSIDRHSHSRNQVSSPCVEFCLLSSRPLRSLFTFGYTRASSTRTRTRPLPESASLHFRQPTWLSAAASLPVRLQGPPSGVTPTSPTFALKIDYHLRLHSQ